MSLVGFRAENHPQQIAVRAAKPEVDDRATDPILFAQLNDRFQFTLDVAAADHNAKCPRYFTRETSGLLASWRGERVWCNPPYSNIEPWLAKAWDESSTAPLIVMLLPANRTEQGWWQRWIEPYRDRHAGWMKDVLRVEFIAGRQRFIAPGASRIGPNERPPFGVCLAIWEMK